MASSTSVICGSTPSRFPPPSVQLAAMPSASPGIPTRLDEMLTVPFEQLILLPCSIAAWLFQTSELFRLTIPLLLVTDIPPLQF